METPAETPTATDGNTVCFYRCFHVSAGVSICCCRCFCRCFYVSAKSMCFCWKTLSKMILRDHNSKKWIGQLVEKIELKMIPLSELRKKQSKVSKSCHPQQHKPTLIFPGDENRSVHRAILSAGRPEKTGWCCKPFETSAAALTNPALVRKFSKKLCFHHLQIATCVAICVSTCQQLLRY